MLNHKVYISCFIAINVIAYLLMCYDKYQSKHKGQRISEMTLFFISFIFGALGIFLGMKAPIYHKAAKAKFKWGIPLFFILNLLCVYLIYRCK